MFLEFLLYFWDLYFRDVETTVCFPFTTTPFNYYYYAHFTGKLNFGENIRFVWDHTGSKQWILELNPDTKKPVFIILYCICWPLIPAKCSFPKPTSQTTDMILRLPNYRIQSSLLSWFSESTGILLNWGHKLMFLVVWGSFC